MALIAAAFSTVPGSHGRAGDAPPQSAHARLHDQCFDYESEQPFATFPGRMFVSYLTFISEADRRDPDSGATIVSFAEALRNDRIAAWRNADAVDENDGFDDYFQTDQRIDAAFRDLVIIPHCDDDEPDGQHYRLRLIERLFSGELMQLSVQLLHLDGGKTGALIHPTP